MQENFPLLRSVLEKLHKAGCLDRFILVGSWATYLYQLYYDSPEYRPIIRTSDVDFLIPNPRKIDPSLHLNVGEILEELDFVKSFHRNGLIKYEAAGLTVEFLTPEVGSGTRHPVKIEGLNVTAGALRFMNMLTENPLIVKIDEIKIKAPHPIAYAFHKLIISERRMKKEKQTKDYQTAVDLLRFLQSKGMQRNIRAYFNSLNLGWKKKIQIVLKNGGDSDLLISGK